MLGFPVVRHFWQSLKPIPTPQSVGDKIISGLGIVMILGQFLPFIFVWFLR
jgi:hypothetical protein